MKRMLTFAVLLSAAVPVFAANTVPPDMATWRARRFGMFIHWGPVSLTGKEIGWSRGRQTPIAVYDDLYKRFNPTEFNADEWVSIAKAAGMKYMILTTKHHDGFCLWDTKYTDYNIMNSPLHRDVVKELSDACKRQGMAFGTYYSVTDWYNPNWPVTSPAGRVKRKTSNMDAYEQYLQSQIRELITKYGPLCTLWNDVPAMYGKVRGQATIDLVRKLAPGMPINNRTGAGGDYDTPEQHIGGFNMKRPWESCMTVSAHNHWAWGGSNDGVKPLNTCLRMLIGCAGGDGNMLLNVGPRPDGVIDPEQASRIKEMGTWLEKYGESIYATRGGPYKPGRWGACTRTGNTIYVHIFKWQGDTIALPPLGKKITGSELLTGGKVEVEQTDDGVTIAVPANDHKDIDTVIKLTIDGPALDIAPIDVTSSSTLPKGSKVTASNVFGKSSTYNAANAFDGDSGTRWATDAGTHSAWIEVALPAARKISSVTIEQEPAYAKRIEAYEFQAEQDGQWKTLCAGNKIGAKGVLKFTPVTAKKFRLNITKANEGPTINEIELVTEK